MGRPSLSKFVNNTDAAATAITTTQVSPTVIQTGFPVGDILYKRLLLRYSGNLNIVSSGAGTIVTRGGLQFLRSVSLETDKHGKLVDGVDGIMLHVMQTVKGHARPVNTDVTSAATGTPTFEYGLELPFIDVNAARPEDVALDLYGARPTLTTQTGIFTDFVSGGSNSTAQVQVYRQEVHVDMDPGPVDIAADGPLLMPYLGVYKYPILATARATQIGIPYGDRVYKRIFITQRNGSTLAELNNTILGANDNDRVTLKVNGFPWIDNIEWLALQDMNAADYELAAMPTGVGVLDFCPRRARGYMHSDALNVINNAVGTAELLLDATTVSNGQIWLGWDAMKPILPGALRPRPANG